jgi:hypothetical protein
MIIFRLLMCLGLGLALTNAAHAQDANVSNADLSARFFQLQKGLSMGGAFRAIADTPFANLYNPAGIAQRKGQLSVSGDYGYFSSDGNHFLGASVIDYQTSPNVAYGLSYHQGIQNFGTVEAQTRQATFSLAHQTQNVLTGASLKGYWVDINNAALDGPRGLDLDVGMLIKAGEMLSFGVVGYNLARGGKIEEYPRMLGGGIALKMPPYGEITMDVVKNFNTIANDDINYHFGVALDVSEQIELRGGYAIDNIRQNDFYGVGLSVQSDRATIHASFGQTLDVEAEIYSVSLEYTM